MSDEIAPADLGKTLGFHQPAPPREESPPHRAAADRHRPQAIGPFHILRPLGEGGMGAVYLAEQQQPVRRLVAIKLMHGTRLASPDARLRFHAERQAMARLYHPNVAQIFEAGATDEGFPYFVMEHVPGQRLTTYADERRLGIGARLQLCEAVCQGVQHAHQRGIIHRDLKPSNILVTEIDGKPVPKIIDFGIAKALDPNDDQGGEPGAGLTGLHAIGTPQYMCPEMLEEVGGGHDVDSRADVYALGLLVGELVAAARPFAGDGGSVARTFSRILRGDLKPPSLTLEGKPRSEQEKIAATRGLSPEELLRAVRGDLDAIVLKAAARDREARYASASELAADLRRVLGNEPVLARAGGARYRLRKFVRRHRAAVAAGAVVALAVVLGAAGTAVGLVRARRAEAHAVAEAGRAQREAASAARVSGFLVDVFTVNEAGESKGSTVTARELLDVAAQRLPNELEGDAAVKATLLHTIGIVYHQLGLYEASTRMFDQALALREKRFGSDAPEVAATLTELGDLDVDANRYDEAERALVRALAIREARLGGGHPDTARTLAVLGNLRIKQGRRDEALPLVERALRIRLEALGPDHLDTGDTWNQVANLYRRQGRFAEAERGYRRALAIRERVLGTDHPEVASALSNLGILLRTERRYAEAEAVYLQAIAILRKSTGERHPLLASALNNLGNLYDDMGKPELAAERLREALAVRRAVLQPGHVDIAVAEHNLGRVELSLGHLEAAESLLREAHDAFLRAVGGDHPHVAFAEQSLGELAVARRQWDEAERCFREALRIRRLRLGEAHADTLATEGDLAIALSHLGRRGEAREHLEHSRGLSAQPRS